MTYVCVSIPTSVLLCMRHSVARVLCASALPPEALLILSYARVCLCPQQSNFWLSATSGPPQMLNATPTLSPLLCLSLDSAYCRTATPMPSHILCCIWGTLGPVLATGPPCFRCRLNWSPPSTRCPVKAEEKKAQKPGVAGQSSYYLTHPFVLAAGPCAYSCPVNYQPARHAFPQGYARHVPRSEGTST